METQLSEWLLLAKADLDAADELLNSQKHVAGVSIYLSHQCVEKCLKFTINKSSVNSKKIHDLMKLTSSAIKFNKSLSSFLAQIQELDQYYPKLRYPTGDRFTTEDAKQCVQIATKIYNEVEKWNLQPNNPPNNIAQSKSFP